MFVWDRWKEKEEMPSVVSLNEQKTKMKKMAGPTKSFIPRQAGRKGCIHGLSNYIPFQVSHMPIYPSLSLSLFCPLTLPTPTPSPQNNKAQTDIGVLAYPEFTPNAMGLFSKQLKVTYAYKFNTSSPTHKCIRKMLDVKFRTEYAPKNGDLMKIVLDCDKSEIYFYGNGKNIHKKQPIKIDKGLTYYPAISMAGNSEIEIVASN